MINFTIDTEGLYGKLSRVRERREVEESNLAGEGEVRLAILTKEDKKEWTQTGQRGPHQSEITPRRWSEDFAEPYRDIQKAE